jgi:ubiquinone/menaquinone biosynthesis C-methylase UbiE
VSQTTDTPLQIDQTSTETTQNGMSRCLELIDFRKDMKALVVGTLDSPARQLIEDRLGPRGSLTLADPMRRKFGRSLTAELLKWDDESFDLVYGHFNLSSAKTPQHSLSELIRVSKPNAKIIVADHDGQDLNHYPLAPYLEKNLIELLQEASRLKIWDPQMGRKLYSLFFESGLRDVRVQVLPHRIICGQLNSQEYEEWTRRLEEVSALKAKGSIQLSFDLDSFRSEFFAFFQNPTRFSYNSVILVEGRKNG